MVGVGKSCKQLQMILVDHCRSNKRRKIQETGDRCYASMSAILHKIKVEEEEEAEAAAEEEGRGIRVMSSERLISCTAEASASASVSCISYTSKNLFSRLIESGVVQQGEGVVYRRKSDGSVLKQGSMGKEGVICSCCSLCFSLSKFETHAGSKNHRPSVNMFLQGDGRSIATCLQRLQEHAEQKLIRNPATSAAAKSTCKKASAPQPTASTVRKVDEICQVCGDEVAIGAGDHAVQLCHGCPSAFHRACLEHPSDAAASTPWFCSLCRCGHCGFGMKCCGQKIEKDQPIRCSQCQVQYHSSCVPALPALKDGAERHGYYTWFCSLHCEDLFTRLRLLVGILHPFADKPGLSWMLVRSSIGDDVAKISSIHAYDTELFYATRVLRECFCPMFDKHTHTDLLSQIVYNLKAPGYHPSRRLDCSGFYTLLLLQDATSTSGHAYQDVVCLATVRIHGSASSHIGFTMAEVPFVATSPAYRLQGLCKRLMLCLETVLKDVGVSRILLPSIPSMMETWTGRTFGFQVLHAREKKQLSTAFNLMAFPGTTLLHKSLDVC